MLTGLLTPIRFTGLSGSYFSLQYLSVSDATVLQFLAPMCTGVVGALVLKEHFTRSQALASRELFPSQPTLTHILRGGSIESCRSRAHCAAIVLVWTCCQQF